MNQPFREGWNPHKNGDGLPEGTRCGVLGISHGSHEMSLAAWPTMSYPEIHPFICWTAVLLVSQCFFFLMGQYGTHGTHGTHAPFLVSRIPFWLLGLSTRQHAGYLANFSFSWCPQWWKSPLEMGESKGSLCRIENSRCNGPQKFRLLQICEVIICLYLPNHFCEHVSSKMCSCFLSDAKCVSIRCQ